MFKKIFAFIIFISFSAAWVDNTLFFDDTEHSTKVTNQDDDDAGKEQDESDIKFCNTPFTANAEMIQPIYDSPTLDPSIIHEDDYNSLSFEVVAPPPDLI